MEKKSRETVQIKSLPTGIFRADFGFLCIFDELASCHTSAVRE
jgi:hypothetical protein